MLTAWLIVLIAYDLINAVTGTVRIAIVILAGRPVDSECPDTKTGVRKARTARFQRAVRLRNNSNVPVASFLCFLSLGIGGLCPSAVPFEIAADLVVLCSHRREPRRQLLCRRQHSGGNHRPCWPGNPGQPFAPGQTNGLGPFRLGPVTTGYDGVLMHGSESSTDARRWSRVEKRCESVGGKFACRLGVGLKRSDRAHSLVGQLEDLG
jgi:hypothetical protein